MRKIQVIDGYKYNTQDRSDEIFNTIKWNSKIFDKIFILCENTEYYEHYVVLQNEVIEVINLNQNNFISMQEMFEFINKNSSSDDIKFLTNLDSIFTERFKEIDVEDGYVYSFTNRSMRNPNINGGIGHESYVRDENDGLVIFNRDGIVDPKWFQKDEEMMVNYIHNAVCGWAWKTVNNLTYTDECFQCYPEAEQCLMFTFRNSGYRLKSAAIKYPTFHNHGSNEKTPNNTHRGVNYKQSIEEIL
jgi:hypothetical protein